MNNLYNFILKKDLKDGDQFFQRNNFNIRDYNTYMSPIIHFGINFWNYIKGRPITPINHCGTLYYEKGIWVVLEAKIKVIKTPLSEKIKNKDITAIYIKRYDLTQDQVYKMYSFGNDRIGTKYDFVSIFKQIFRQIFNQKIDLETNPNIYENKKVNCSELNSEQLNAAGIKFNNTKSVDPDDLWKDERSFVVGRIK